jgi:hypothetical protein
MRVQSRFTTLEQPRSAASTPARARGDVDRREAAPVSFATFAGEVRSRETWTRSYVAPVVVTPTTITQSAQVQIANVQGAVQDQRIPNVGVSVNGNTITVDGLALTVSQQGDQLSVTASAIGLQGDRVSAALKKLVMLANTHKILTLIDNNKHMMVTPQIILEPNGRLRVVTTANVRVDPNLTSQHQNVLDQRQGGLTAPEVARRRQREKGKRTQVVG